MQITGKYGFVTVNGRTLRFLNQRSREWTHPYEYPPHPGGTLTSSGCGIFSACHAAEVMSGKRVSPELLADFSCREGGTRRRRHQPSEAAGRDAGKGSGRVLRLPL